MTTPTASLIVLSMVQAACTGPPSPPAAPLQPVAPTVTGSAWREDRASVISPERAPKSSADLEPLMPPALEYTPRGRRDPFTPIRAPEDTASLRSVLTSARLTGIVRGPGGSWVLVETLDGTGFILRPGEDFGEARLLEIGGDFALFDMSRPSASMPTRVVLRLEPTP